MGDRSADRHPEPDELQRCVDGELDPERDAALVAHVESCAACRAEVQQIRRVTAALCLTSEPPTDLFQRIKARRDAGERVELSVPLVDAQGEATAVGVVPATVRGRATTARRSRAQPAWRWAIGSVGLAAAALLAVRLTMREDRVGDPVVVAVNDTLAPAEAVGSGSRTQGPVPAPGVPAPQPPRRVGAGVSTTDRLRGVDVTRDSSAGRSSPKVGSAGATGADSSTPTRGAARGSVVVLRESSDGFGVRLAFISRGLDRRQIVALDSAVLVWQRAPERRVVIRYADLSFNRESDSWRLALRAKAQLESRGVLPARIRLVRVQAVNTMGLLPQADAVEVLVQRP
jgi:hypothetical protein